MNSKITRKEFLSDATRYAAGMMVGVAGAQLTTAHAAPDVRTPDWPWPYAPLDPERVRVLGHDLFWQGKACCAGSFGAILTALQEEVGEPFTQLPAEIMLFGHGGGVGWGTVCGALNGPAAAISLVSTKEVSDKLINELFGWYTQTELPTEKSNEYATTHVYGDNRYDLPLIRNLCGSPICHVSVTEWCNVSGQEVGSTARKERCARITGDVAAYAVELRNQEHASQFTGKYVPPASIAGCMSCHGSGFVANVAAKMECGQCHPTAHTSTTVEHVSTIPGSHTLEQSYPNPFSSHTQIPFSIPGYEQLTLRVYDARGRLVRTLIDHEARQPGSYVATWDGVEESGSRAPSGVYFIKLKAGAFSQTRKVSLVH